MKKGKITFENLDIDGRHQKEWFRIFDLLEEIYTEEERNNMDFVFIRSTIHGFHSDPEEMLGRSIKCEFYNGVCYLSNKQAKRKEHKGLLHGIFNFIKLKGIK